MTCMPAAVQDLGVDSLGRNMKSIVNFTGHLGMVLSAPVGACARRLCLFFGGLAGWCSMCSTWRQGVDTMVVDSACRCLRCGGRYWGSTLHYGNGVCCCDGWVVLLHTQICATVPRHIGVCVWHQPNSCMQCLLVYSCVTGVWLVFVSACACGQVRVPGYSLVDEGRGTLGSGCFW